MDPFVDWNSPYDDITDWPVGRLDELGLAVHEGVAGVEIVFDGDTVAHHGVNTPDEQT